MQVAYGLGPVGQAFDVRLPDAHLWSPADPFLYNVTIGLTATKQRAASFKAVSMFADSNLVSTAITFQKNSHFCITMRLC